LKFDTNCKMRARSFYFGQEQGNGGSVDNEWLATFAPVFNSDQPVILGNKGAQAIWASQNFVLSHSVCERANLLGRPFLAGSRLLDHLGLCLVLDGAIEVEAGNEPALAEADDIVLLDLREPMRLVFGAQGSVTSLFALWVPRARLPAQLSSRSALHGLVAKAIAPAVAVAAAALRALLTQLDTITIEEMDDLTSGVTALVGHAIGSCTAPQASQPKAAAPLDTFVILCRYIEGNLAARDLGVAKLAATFGLSRASLYRLFEPVGGVASFIRERRLARAHEALSAPGLHDRRIGPIAYQAGFHSIATFNRAFIAAYGETPRSVRKQKAGRARPVKPLPEELGVLARWLLDTAA
jgi:AraC-like DNA-binding protein